MPVVICMTDFDWMQVYACDGYFCPVTDQPFGEHPDIEPITAQCAHILPFSLHDKVCFCVITFQWAKFDIYVVH